MGSSNSSLKVIGSVSVGFVFAVGCVMKYYMLENETWPRCQMMRLALHENSSYLETNDQRGHCLSEEQNFYKTLKEHAAAK